MKIKNIINKIILLGLIVIGLYFFFFVIHGYSVEAQTLKIESIRFLTTDLSGLISKRFDKNGKICALIKVGLPTNGVEFEGNVIGNVTYKAGEYWVYVTENTKFLKIKHQKYSPVMIRFDDSNVGIIESGKVYGVNLLFGDTTDNKEVEGEKEYSLAHTYLDKGDNEKYFYWLQESAKKDHPFSLYELGIMYEKGMYYSVNYSQAIKLYNKAANQGFALGNKRIQLIRQLLNCLGVEDENSFQVKSAETNHIIIYFQNDEYQITNDEKVLLKCVANTMKETPNGQYTLTGYHHNYTGTAESNNRIRTQRVESVKRFLLNLGVNSSQLETRIDLNNLTDFGIQGTTFEQAVTITLK